MSEAIKLKIIEGKLSGKEFVFEEPGSYLVGRSPSCAIQIHKADDEKVSRKHFVLTFSPTGIKIRDLDSRNGTLVNGEYIATGNLFPEPEKIEPFDFPLKDGDKISLGKTVISLSLISKEEIPEKETPVAISEETIPLTTEAKEIAAKVANAVTTSEVKEEQIAATGDELQVETVASKAPAVPPPVASLPPAEKPVTPPAPSLAKAEEVSLQEDTVVLNKPKAVPPPVSNSIEKLKEQFKPPQMKPKSAPPKPSKKKVEPKEETSVMDSPKAEPPPLTATAPKTETSTMPADALAKQAPRMPAGMQAGNQGNSAKPKTSTDLQIKKPDDAQKNLEEIAKGKVLPPLSPDALGAKKTSSLKVKAPGTGVNDSKPIPEPPADPNAPKKEIVLSDLETIQVERDDVLDDIDIESMVSKSKFEKGKRTTKFTVKGPS